MTNDPVLFNDWHPVATVAELDETPLSAIRLLDEDIVVWRAGARLHAWRDACVHRGTRLSLGKIIDGDCIQCPYHGWIYDGIIRSSENSCAGRIPYRPAGPVSLKTSSTLRTSLLSTKIFSAPVSTRRS